ncbi:MAG: hypothetical protein K2J60_03615 [Acetatifactor sp.]|nr:hypothetical protein [Acetatifactor sp.]
MFLTDQELDEIEKYADKKKKADILLIVQTLREVREMKALLEAHKDASNCCNSSSDCKVYTTE